MKAYYYHRSTGNKYSFILASGEVFDEVNIALPAGAKEITTEAGDPAIELANGEVCPDLLTANHDGTSQPYIVSSDNAGSHRVYLKVVAKC